MKLIKLFLLTALLVGVAGVSASHGQTTAIPVVVSPSASEGERLAAQDLVAGLQRIYPRERFVFGERLPNAGRGILVGNAQTDPEVMNRLGGVKPGAPESFVVTTVGEGPQQMGLVAGADARGAAYGVYALLESLGAGFFLSYDAWPAPRTNAFSFDGWQLADRPLVKDRIVFNWHNFLSGCSTWNFEDWRRWTAQSRKMGYNSVMVHAYGNNPMVNFTFNGKPKPVGYLSTTVRGRDWSTMHVNDVRRLWGGEVFDQAVFGADAAMAPEDERVAAARHLMQQVFADAARRDLEVFLAVDVDTGTANPQELVLTLPEHARFATDARVGGASGLPGQGRISWWLPNPDTPEGYRYYQAQVESLLKVYPQITCLVVWFRTGGTPWMEAQLTEMPPAWQREYAVELARTPAAADLWRAPQVFALSKIVRAFDRALKEQGRHHVQLASGTWRFDFLPSCHRFFPPHVKLIGLDYEVLHGRPQLRDSDSRKILRDVGTHRAVVPVIWAHHDDGNYIGRSYTPFAEFQSKLADARASGFGIIHWTTRPLDLYFKGHAQHVWERTRDQPLRATCDAMAERSFGGSAGRAMGEYLERWVTEAPKFGRETSDWFIDKPLTNASAVVAGCHDRLRLIATVDAGQLSADQRDRLNYFKGLEEFMLGFFQAQSLFQRSQEAFKQGRLGEARELMDQCRPESVIEQFARFSSLGGITRGEQGLVVTFNLRWLTHLLRHRQALGLDSVCVSFGPTMHEPLAQSAGKFTFDVTTNRVFWERWGQQETGATAWTLPSDAKVGLGRDDPGAWAEIARHGIAFTQPLKLRLQPIMAVDSRGRTKPATLPAGDYLVRLLFADPSPQPLPRLDCDIEIRPGSAFEQYTFAPVTARYLRVLCSGNTRNDWSSLTEVQLDSVATVDGAPAVSASSSVSERYPATHVLDGDPDTRWAARGTNQWLQFTLTPGAFTQRIGLAWHQPDNRRHRFTVQVSDDAVRWTPVNNFRRRADMIPIRDRIELVSPGGSSASSVMERSFRATLAVPGYLDLTIAPVEGRASLCGIMVEPLVQPDK